jgi:hypothetical protein
MEVTEKCDVYSFGVLTLEILFESTPGDIVSTYLYLFKWWCELNTRWYVID